MSAAVAAAEPVLDDFEAALYDPNRGYHCVGPGLIWPGQPDPEYITLDGRSFWSTGWHVIQFIESHCVFTNGEWIGDRAKLLRWERHFLYRLFEVEVDKKGFWIRRYRRCLLGIPRKNGKSELAGWLALYLLLEDGEPAPWIVLGANSDTQADVVFQVARVCVEQSPTLRDRVAAFDSEIQALLLARGKIERISFKAKTKEGLHLSGIVLDELHGFDEQGRQLYTVVTKGTVARRQPLTILITTAGNDKSTLCGELYDHGIAVREGRVKDHRFFFQWFEAPQALPIDDEATWRIANPSYGVTVSAEALTDILNDTGSRKADFRRYHLNQWIKSSASWLDEGEWEACDVGEVYFDLDLPIFVGVDASSRHDTTAIVAAQWCDDVLLVVCWVWERPTLPDGKPDYEWKLPIEQVKDRLRKLHTTYTATFGFDPALITWVAQELTAEGLDMVEVPQSNARMAPAAKALLELIRERRLGHDGDETLARHIANAIHVDTGNGGFRLAKVRRGKAHSVQFANDAAIALVIAISLAAKPETPPEPDPRVIFLEDYEEAA